MYLSKKCSATSSFAHMLYMQKLPHALKIPHSLKASYLNHDIGLEMTIYFIYLNLQLCSLNVLSAIYVIAVQAIK